VIGRVVSACGFAEMSQHFELRHPKPDAVKIRTGAASGHDLSCPYQGMLNSKARTFEFGVNIEPDRTSVAGKIRTRHGRNALGTTPGACGCKSLGATSDFAAPIVADLVEGTPGGELVVGDKGHVGKAIQFQIGSAVGEGEVLEALLHSGPRHARE
jgi:hypothetical protein